MPLKQTKEVPVEARIPEGFVMLFTNYSIVQTTGPDVVISFFQAIAPLAKTQEEMDRLESIPGECVTRIVMNPFAAQRLLAGLQDVMDAFQQKMKEQAGNQGGGEGNA